MNIVLVSSVGSRLTPEIAPDGSAACRHLLSEQEGIFYSQETIDGYCEALTKIGYGVAEMDGGPFLASGLIPRIQDTDVVLNIAMGFGCPPREAYVPLLIESLGLVCTGSDSLTTAICQDKFSCKEVLRAGGIPVPRGRLVESMDDLTNSQGFEFPMMLKPNCWSASKGIHQGSILKDITDLVTLCEGLFDDGLGPLLLEEFLPGVDITYTLLGSDLLPPVQVRTGGWGQVFDWRLKRLLSRDQQFSSEHEFMIPYAPASGRVATLVGETAQRVVKHLSLRDWATIDIRLYGQIPYVIDVNPIPVLLPDSSLQTTAGASIMEVGVSFDQALQIVCESAMSRAVGCGGEEVDLGGIRN